MTTCRRSPGSSVAGERSDPPRDHAAGTMPKTVPVPSDAAPTASGRPPFEADPRSLGHLRGLDGLRAVAVLAVVIYHAGLGGLSGGFLGVEVFFVISGFLITAILLARAPGDRPDRSGRLLAPSGAPAAAGAVLPPCRDARLRRARRARGDRPIARRRHRGRRVRHQLAPDRRRPVVLRVDRAPVALRPPLVARDRGAVLPGLAARARRSLLLVGRPCGARVDPRWALPLGGLDGAPVRPGERPVTGLLRHGHPAHRAAAWRGPRVRLGAAGPVAAQPRVRAEPAPAAAAAGQGGERRPLGQRPARAGRSTSSASSRSPGSVRSLCLPAHSSHSSTRADSPLLAVLTVVVIAAAVHPRAHIGRLLDMPPAALGRHAVVFDLPVALADLCADAPRARRAVRCAGYACASAWP